jgi:membrane associated rhomboid family serine protease
MNYERGASKRASLVLRAASEARGYVMSETELSVICKNCGSEVSPYVTECPYCGARLRKRAPKLERRGDALEAKPRRRRTRPKLIRRRRRPDAAPAPFRPYATMAAILGSAVLLLMQKATGDSLATFGGLIVPVDDELWRFLAAPFAYLDVGYLFVVAIGLAIFATGLERRLGTVPTGALLVACGSLGVLAASGIANAVDEVEVIAGGNGMALGALAAWFVLRRGEARGAVDDDYDVIGVIVAAAVLLALPIFESTADPFAGLAGGLVGGLAGLTASSLRE